MFDDLFNAAALAAVGGVLAAGVWIGLADEQKPTPAPTMAVRAPARINSARPAMPIYDMPRVVVTGNRSRDGDMLAAERPVADTARGGR